MIAFVLGFPHVVLGASVPPVLYYCLLSIIIVSLLPVCLAAGLSTCLPQFSWWFIVSPWGSLEMALKSHRHDIIVCLL